MTRGTSSLRGSIAAALVLAAATARADAGSALALRRSPAAVQRTGEIGLVLGAARVEGAAPREAPRSTWDLDVALEAGVASWLELQVSALALRRDEYRLPVLEEGDLTSYIARSRSLRVGAQARLGEFRGGVAALQLTLEFPGGEASGRSPTGIVFERTLESLFSVRALGASTFESLLFEGSFALVFVVPGIEGDVIRSSYPTLMLDGAMSWVFGRAALGFLVDAAATEDGPGIALGPVLQVYPGDALSLRATLVEGLTEDPSWSAQLAARVDLQL